MITEVDFTDMNEAEATAALDTVIELFARLQPLDATTRREVLAGIYPELAARILALIDAGERMSREN